MFAQRREKIQIQLTTYSHKLLLAIGVLKERLWWNWHHDKGSLLETIDNAKFTFQRRGRGFLCIFANYVTIFQIRIQLHIIEPLFMFVTICPFSKVGYMHLATRFLSKAGYWQQSSFQRLDICIFAKMFSKEVTYIFQGFFSKVGYMHLWQQCWFSKVGYMHLH